MACLVHPLGGGCRAYSTELVSCLKMAQEGARQDQSRSEAPMSEYNSNALTALQGELRTKVVMGPLLVDMLEKPAGGFMNAAEALTVRNAESPMGQLIGILLGKGDKEFAIFCEMLRKSNHCAWAVSLKQKAESLRTGDRQQDSGNADATPIVPEIKADYVEIKRALVRVCTAQESPTLKEVKDLCLDLLDGVFQNIPRMSGHANEISKATTIAEIMRIVCFKLSNWLSYDFLKMVIAEFQPILQSIAAKLACYENKLKPLLLQKLGKIKELQQNEETPQTMAELKVKYRLDQDGLFVIDLITERDFLAQRLCIPPHLLQVLSWRPGSVSITYWIVRDVLPLAELALCRTIVREELITHGVEAVYLDGCPLLPGPVDHSLQSVHLQRRAIVVVIDAHHKDLDVNLLASDLKDMGIFTTELCQKLTSLDEKDRRHDALLYSLLAHEEPDMYHRLVKCVGQRNASIAADLQATFMDLTKPPGALSVGSSQSTYLMMDDSRRKLRKAAGLEELLCASEELLREALRQAKVILSTRLPIDFLPMVLESKDLISSAECQMIKGERNDVEKSLKLLDMIEKKSIPAIQTFLGILKSDENMRGYGYLAEIVERDCAALVRKKAVTSDDGELTESMKGGRTLRKRPSTSKEVEACPRRANTAPPCASTQLPQSQAKYSVYLQPSVDGDTCIMLPPMPVDLQVISSILLEQKVYITGIATDHESRCILVFSLSEFRWSKLKVAPNYNAPTAVISGHITLIGGRVSETSITNDVYSWIQEEDDWKQIIPSMPKARLESGICHHEGLFLVIGGVEDTNHTEPVDTVVVYNFRKKCWVTVRALQLPKGLRSPHVVMFKEYVYLLGGGTTYPALFQHGVDQCNQEAWRARWSVVKGAVIVAEDAPKLDEHTRVADEEPSKEVESVWKRIADPPVLRPTVVSSKDYLMAVGGINRGGMPQNGIHAFIDDGKDDEKNGDCCGSWRLMGNMSVGRYRHAVVPLGSLGATLFIAGGYVLGNPAGDEAHAKTASVELVAL